MNERTEELVRSLRLNPHPEGGHYRELFRSPALVVPEDGRGERSALTTIYFLLRAGEHSSLHRVVSDEIWHHYEGAPLELVYCDEDFQNLTRVELSSGLTARQPVAVVPAGSWQAARSTGDYTLMGCSVGPGFDFDDFAMMRDNPEAIELLRRRQPDLERLL